MTYPRTSGAKKAVNKHNALQEKIPCSGEESKPLNQSPNSVGKIPALAGQTALEDEAVVFLVKDPRARGANSGIGQSTLARADTSPLIRGRLHRCVFALSSHRLIPALARQQPGALSMRTRFWTYSRTRRAECGTCNEKRNVRLIPARAGHTKVVNEKPAEG